MASRCSSSSLKVLLLIAAAALFFSPLEAFSESITLIGNAARNQQNLLLLQNEFSKKVKLSLDARGNIMVRYGTVSCTVIYAPVNFPGGHNLPGLESSDPQLASLGNIGLIIGVKF